MNKSASKKTLIASAAAVSLSALLFAGTTYAWFTDSASSAVSTIQSGNLDVNLLKGTVTKEISEDTNEETTTIKYTSVGANDLVFDNVDTWEPGYATVQYLRVENKGSLALEYKLTVDITNNKTGISVNKDVIDLTTVLKAAIVPADAAYANRAEAIKAAEANGAVTLDKLASATGQLLAGDTGYKDYAVIIYMPETVDNSANHNGTDIPSVKLGVTVDAKQWQYETDSFNNTYDANATYSGYQKASSNVITESDVANPVELSTDSVLKASVINSVVIDLGGQTLSVPSDNTGNNGICEITGETPTLILKNGTFQTSTAHASLGNLYIGGMEDDETYAPINVYCENVDFTADNADKNYTFLMAVATNGTVTFKNCTFDQTNFFLYLGWAEGESVSIDFEDCNFIKGKAAPVEIIIDSNGGIANITFTRCTYQSMPVTAENTTSVVQTSNYKGITFTVIE
jgi:predicted ribosomally synthesized peptide with SipW-like signal peptide